MRSTRSVVGAFLLGGVAACGPDSSSPVDAARPDVIEGPASCNASGVIRTMVVGINGDTDSIKVFGLDGGTIVDPNIEFPAENPDDVAIRSDGAEAIVSFGGFGQKYGVYVLELGPNASSARIKQTLEIGMDRVPWGLTYASDDHVLFATAAGSSGHSVTAIDRGTNGDFTAGQVSLVPNEWPLGVQGRPGHAEAALWRAELGTDPDTTFYRLQPDGSGAWNPAGTPAAIPDTPLFMAFSPDGDQMYVPTVDPNDRVSSSNLDGKGLVYTVPVSGSGFGTSTTIGIPGQGGMLAVDPKGAFMLIASPIYELDPGTGTPISHEMHFFTIPRTGSTLGTVQVQSMPYPALLLYGLEVTDGGHVVRSRQLYPQQAPEAEQTPIDVLLPDGTGNYMTCATRYLPGQGRFAVSRKYTSTM